MGNCSRGVHYNWCTYDACSLRFISVGAKLCYAENTLLVFLLIEIVSNGVFVFFDFSIPVYIIVNGLILLMFVLIYNSIYRTKM